ncbi:MAG: menC [Acidimicrobiales bacterium]|nr:menC [Acidimicrobiales bacterium]
MTEGSDGPPVPSEVELRWVRMPLRAPMRSGHGAESTREVVLVRVQLDDGGNGWGECSALSRPTYTGEYTAGAWAVLRDELVPDLLARRRSSVVGHPMAAAGLATAQADADLRRIDRSLTEQLGRAQRVVPASHVPTCAVIGRLDRIDDLLDEVAAAIQQGAAAVKLKITPSRRDLDHLRAVRATWPTLALAADLNGTAGVAHIEVLTALDSLGLLYLEQPVTPEDLVTSALVASRLGTPVALDESVTSLAMAEAALRLAAGSVLNVKPARLGGPLAAARLAGLAADSGVAAFCGGMLETGVGRAAALAVAALPACTLPTDLGPSSRYFASDVTAPIEAGADGTIPVPTGPGIGVVPDPDRLDECTVDRLILHR